jgi:hypothetical protein
MRPSLTSRPDLSVKTIHNNLSKLRRCIGPEHLPDASSAGGYLIEGVALDWVEFQRLTREADSTGGQAARALRHEALALVRGKPFEDTPSDAYDWVGEEHLASTVTMAIARCATTHASDLLESGDPQGAEAAVRAGLRGAPEDYGL